MNFKRWFFMSLALLVAASFAAPQLFAQTQTTGDITGVITDQSGGVVPQAKVTIKDSAKGSTQDTQSNKEGVYRFFLLPPGRYIITASATSFQPVSRPVDVNVGQVASVNVQLQVAASNTTVTVTEEAPLIQSEDGNVATTLNSQQVSQVPNPGNDLTYIAQLAPGSVANTAGGLGNFSSFGVSATSNLFTLNGMDDNDPFLNLNNSGATNLLLGSNEVQEATVVANGYTAQYGGLAGASVNYVTKGGGNDYHGNAIYYWNGRAFNANDWLQKAGGADRPFSNANQWAGSFGGPIKKDKAFYYVNTEGLRVVLPTAFTVFLPTQEFETATIANLNANGLAASVPFYQNMFNLYNGTSVSGTPTALGCFNVAVADINCVNQFQKSATNLTSEWQFTGRADYNFSANDRAFVRVEYDHGHQASGTDPISPLFNIQSDQPQWQGQLVENHVFSPTMTNQFILSGAWYSAIFDNANRAATLAAFRTTLVLNDGSLSNLGGNSFGLGDFIFPQGRNVTQYQISDDVTKTFGSHAVSFGGKFRRNDVGDHDFGTATSGLVVEGSLNDFFNGGGENQYTQAFPTAISQPVAIYTLGGYVQDQWRVRPNLTLTLSLRADHDSNPVCQTNCIGRLNAPFLSANHDPNVPYSQALELNLHRTLTGLDSLLWAPRVAFAWQPFGSSRNTVVRGGIGIFYDAFPGVLVDAFAANPPLINTFTTVNNNLADTQASNVYADAAADNQAFLNGFQQGLTLNQIANSLPPGVFVPPVLASSDLHSKVPQYQKWSLEVQQGFGNNTAVSVSYVGNHSTYDLIQNASINAFCDPTDPNQPCFNAAATPGTHFGSLPLTAPDPRFGTVTQYQNAGVSNYNGLVVSFNHKFTRWTTGQFSANYTWSHAFDIASNGGLTAVPFGIGSTGAVSSLSPPQDPNNIRGNYGPADYDVRHYFSANYVWQVPVRTALRGHGYGPLVDGWQVSGTVFSRSGLPYTVIDSRLGAQLLGNNYGSAIIPTFLGGPTDSCGKAAAAGTTPCLDLSQFIPHGTETGFTTGLRNNYRGPSYFNTDFSVMKNTKIPGWERGQLGIGLQFFNVFNHPNFATPDFSISHTGTFGQIFTTIGSPTSILGSFLGGDSSPRLIQLKAQFTF
ncbi:MAG: carboxypeptidase regulatory-like domain-containing protein [Candidatus Acidiferrales bacterium]